MSDNDMPLPNTTANIPVNAAAASRLTPELVRLVFAYLAAAAAWLLFGTSVGEYLGIKFVSPEVDSIAWLSFGRLRPVHTNAVFWGWGSLAALGLAIYIVPRTSQRQLYSIRNAWISFWILNVAALIGVITLMMGINNSGQEYREFVWPVMALYASGVILMFHNLYMTIARRATEDIYISNWYIMAAIAWTIIVIIIGYLPFYTQDGISQTVIQGYYMHMGVGMWFTPLALGVTYYVLPALLNKPIYSYSLGVLAFWTQMVFYTLIGSHHFVFSPIPWWLQTIGIVFSFGMVITLAAGTGNFLMTMRGSGRTIRRSYSLPFILVGVLSYFIFSIQGSLEALRSLNEVWHFTNFTVAHSHQTMYGFVAFLLWGGIYGLLPRLTSRAPNRAAVGVHFWFALVGMVVYTVPLMIGGTLQGLSWIEGNAFMESVILMAPHWIWRAIGGSMMLLSHFVFIYNMWAMRPVRSEQKAVAKAAALSEAAA